MPTKKINAMEIDSSVADLANRVGASLKAVQLSVESCCQGSPPARMLMLMVAL